jgi:pantoate--beta-alanine ligase
MRIISSVKEIREAVRTYREKECKIGFVPTMGYFHEGHISLIKTSLLNNDITIASIFVNPTQFGEIEDYDRYPRNMERDIEIARDNDVDIIFTPSVEEIYPDGFKTKVIVKELTEKLCGKYRPGHFDGVCTIVSKLLNIIRPDNAYFGQKDAQQFIVIRRMVKDLNIDANIVVCPIIREKDGLAMSSRNIYLKSEERKASVLISRALFEAENKIKDGERDVTEIIREIKNILDKSALIKPQYIEAVDTDTLENISVIKGRILLAIAAYVGNVRLIDNIIMEVD